MPFALFRRRRKQVPPDPLAAYDALIEDLERQGAGVRRAAATLLALRGELRRSAERAQCSGAALASRVREAEARGEVRLAEVLRRDVASAEQQLAAAQDALERSEADAALLLEAGRELAQQIETLRLERAGAAARLALDNVVTTALRERVARFERVLALDAARDEVARAHALADLYREERAQRGEG